MTKKFTCRLCGVKKPEDKRTTNWRIHSDTCKTCASKQRKKAPCLNPNCKKKCFNKYCSPGCAGEVRKKPEAWKVLQVLEQKYNKLKIRFKSLEAKLFSARETWQKQQANK